MLYRLRKTTAVAPTPMAALALGISSLGWCWEYTAAFAGHAQQAAAWLASVLLVILLLKFILQPRLLWQELAHPLTGSVLPALSMAFMVVSVALPAELRVWLWLPAVLLHLVFLGCFIWHRVQDLRLQLMVPGWFVPPVGIITAVLTCPPYFSGPLQHGIFWFGLACYSLLLPLMLFRLLFAGTLPDAAKPTIAVLAAPASLSLAGYLSLATEPSALLVAVLLGIALLMTALVYLALILLLRLPFSPAFAAYTFPLVIGATALFKTSQLFGLWQKTAEASILLQLAYLELAVATAVTLYVCIRYICYFWPQPAAGVPATG